MYQSTIKYFSVYLIIISQLCAGPNTSSLREDHEQNDQNSKFSSNYNKPKFKDKNKLNSVDAIAIGTAAVGAITVIAVGSLITYGLIKNADQNSSESFMDDQEYDLYSQKQKIIQNKSINSNSDINFESANYQLNASVIDLTLMFNNNQSKFESSKIDLHPQYTYNPHKLLKNQLFKMQRDYHHNKLSDAKVYIITGTAKARGGPILTLQGHVKQWLQEDYIQRRIQSHWLSQEGLYSVVLRKNILKQELST